MRPSRLSLALIAGAFAGGVLLVGPASADTLELKDGRIVEGMVVPADEGFLVMSRFGVSEVAKADVVKHTEAKPVDQQIKDHLASLGAEDTANRALFAGWLKGIGREDEARNVAASVLDLEPENAKAHEVLGHVRSRGRWVTPEAAKQAQGLEKHGEHWYTPEEWQNLADADKHAASEAEQRADAQRLGRDVNRALRLMTSPDEAVRARARKKLERLAAELDSQPLRDLLLNMDGYILKVDEARAKAAELSDSALVGSVLGDFRITLAKLKRPIQEFTTNLAAGPIGANAPVTLQLPELEVIKIRTTGIIPVVGP